MNPVHKLYASHILVKSVKTSVSPKVLAQINAHGGPVARQKKKDVMRHLDDLITRFTGDQQLLLKLLKLIGESDGKLLTNGQLVETALSKLLDIVKQEHIYKVP